MIGAEEMSRKLDEIELRWPDPGFWCRERQIDQPTLLAAIRQFIEAMAEVREDPEISHLQALEGTMSSLFCLAYELGLEHSVPFGIGARLPE